MEGEREMAIGRDPGGIRELAWQNPVREVQFRKDLLRSHVIGEHGCRGDIVIRFYLEPWA